MTTETNNYLVRCDNSTAEFLMSEIQKITGTDPRQTDIKGIGGGTEWILFGTVALDAIKALLELIKVSIEAGRTIKGIKIGDRELNDPKATNITELQKRIDESK
jgi:hypothetical protein